MKLKNENLVEALRKLETSDENRSETSRLIDVFDNVESALGSGVHRAAVLAALHSQGFKMTAKSFESAIYRIRKKRKLSVTFVNKKEPTTGPVLSLDSESKTPSLTSFFPSPSADEIYARKNIRESLSSHRKKTIALPRR